MFVQRLNAEGVLEWVVFGEEQQQADPSPTSAAAAVASSLASSLYADMLHDRPRAAAYAAALTAVVPRFQRPLVLDVGTGTGLLGVLAARADAAATVVACDQYPPMARLARQTVAAAGLSGRVTVHACRSDELGVGGGEGCCAALPRRADVVVSEILDSILLGEGALPTAADVGRRLLAPGGVAIPARGRVLAQAVACPALRACWDASGWVGGGEGAACGLGGDPTPRPLHLDRLAAEGRGLVPLGPPAVILEDGLDLTAPTAVEGRVVAAVPVAAAAGGGGAATVDALAVWWEVDLTPEGDVTLDTAPGWVKAVRHPWIDHWKACWVPAGAGAGAGAVQVEVSFGPADLAVRAVPPSPSPSSPSSPSPSSPSSLAACYAPSGLGLWATSLRAPALEAAVAAAVAAAANSTTAPPLRVVTLGDGPLPALAALRAGVAGVTAVVTSSPAAAAAVARVVESAGGAVTADAPPPPPPTQRALLLLAEPHYRATETRPLEALFRFLRDRQALADAGSLGSAVTVLPSRARVVAVGLAAPDLARTARPVEQVEGVDMAPFDAAMAAVGSDGGRWLARSVGWQCGEIAETTGRAGLGGDLGGGQLSGSVALPAAATLAGSAVLLPAGGCPASVDAIAVWVEYGYGSAAGGDGGGGGGFETASTAPAGPAGGPAPGTQAVFLLPAPVAVPPAGLGITLTLDVSSEPALGGHMDVRARVAVVTA